jgi:hypothetical protein
MTDNPSVIRVNAGLRGATGATGETGATGATGAAGAAGTNGIDGVAGEAFYTDKGTVSSGTVTFDRTGGVISQRLQVGGNLIIATTGWPTTGTYGELLIEIVNGGSATLTFADSITWITDDSLPPTFQASGTDFFVLWTHNGGSLLFGSPLTNSSGSTVLPDADYGDVIVSASGTVFTVDSVGGLTFSTANSTSDRLFGWDDSAASYANLTSTDARIALGLATTDTPTFVGINLGSTLSVITGTTYGVGVLNGVPVISGSIVEEATTAKTLALTDATKTIEFTNSSASVLTIPSSGSVAFVDGTYINLTRKGSGAVSVTTGAGVTLLSKSSARILSAQYSMATIYKSSADSWILGGDVSTA